MPTEFDTQFKETLNVSAAFDNCFFHNYLLHLFANGLDLPIDLFTFKSILGDKGTATELQKRFPNIDCLSVFADYTQRKHPSLSPISPSFIFEKTIILGLLMREWFATTIAQNRAVAMSIEKESMTEFKNYKEFRGAVESPDDLFSDATGVLFQANAAFLEYFWEHPKEGHLTAKEQQFKNYFTDAHEDVDLALKNYWQTEGYKNYCTLIAQKIPSSPTKK